MDKILVIALARIGDLVQCFPVFSDVNRLTGNEGISVMVQKELLPVAQLHPSVKEVIPFDGDKLLESVRNDGGWSKEGLDYLNSLIERVERLNPQLTVNLTHTSFSAMFCGSINSHEMRGRIDYPNRGPHFYGDWVRYFYTLLNSRICNAYNLVDVHREIAGGIPGLAEKMIIPEDARHFAREKLNGCSGKYKIALGVGANHPLRRWPATRWSETVAILRQRCDADFIFLGSLNERKIADNIAGNSNGRCLNLCGDTDPVQLAAVINECDAYIGHDSGPLHVAASLKKPCLGIFLAMASAWETAPYVEDAITIEPNISCHPCSEKGGCVDPKCHHLINSESVALSTISLLGNGVPPLPEGGIIKKTGFDSQNRLILEGQYKWGDNLGLTWRSLLDRMLTSWPQRKSSGDSRVISSGILPEMIEKIDELKNVIVPIAGQTIHEFGCSNGDAFGLYSDPMHRQIPFLISKFPEFRPVFELYDFDCLNGDLPGIGSRLEKVLIAQEKMLRRIALIQEQGFNLAEQNRKKVNELTVNAAGERHADRVAV